QHSLQHTAPTYRQVDTETAPQESQKRPPATGDDETKKEARRKAFSRAIRDANDKRLIGSRDIGATTFVWFADPTQESEPALAKPKMLQAGIGKSKSDDLPYGGPIVDMPDWGPDPLDEHGNPND